MWFFTRFHPCIIQPGLWRRFSPSWYCTMHNSKLEHLRSQFQLPPRDDRRKTRGQDGSLLFPCRTLSFPATCRFIPELAHFGHAHEGEFGRYSGIYPSGFSLVSSLYIKPDPACQQLPGYQRTGRGLNSPKSIIRFFGASTVEWNPEIDIKTR